MNDEKKEQAKAVLAECLMELWLFLHTEERATAKARSGMLAEFIVNKIDSMDE